MLFLFRWLNQYWKKWIVEIVFIILHWKFFEIFIFHSESKYFYSFQIYKVNFKRNHKYIKVKYMKRKCYFYVKTYHGSFLMKWETNSDLLNSMYDINITPFHELSKIFLRHTMLHLWTCVRILYKKNPVQI